MPDQDIPTHKDLMNPTLQALRGLGGSGTNDEIANQIIDSENYPDDIVEIPHSEDGSQTEIEYRIAWAKTYLKKYGLLENSERGVWALTTEGWEVEEVDPSEVDQDVRNQSADSEQDLEEKEKEETKWKNKVFDYLSGLSSEGFENLCKRLLRESGFVEVTVTQQSGDHGIDGRGILKLSDLLSFHVVFQAKRWQNSVGPGVIRDFRGSMQGRADKGLIIITSSFTRGAKEEATRDGATPIDLVDGDKLTEMMKENRIGIEVEEIVQEKVSIEEDYFLQIDNE